MTKLTFSSQDDFEYWVADMEDALERFASALPAEVRARLDYSPASLDVIEHWILSKFASSDDFLKRSTPEDLDGTARYIGEVFQRVLSGSWDIHFDDPKDAFYGLPIVTGMGPDDDEDCPHTLATAAADRRSGTYLRGVLEGYMMV